MQIFSSRFIRLVAVTFAVLATAPFTARAQGVDEWITEYTGSPLYPSQHGQPGRPGLDAANEKFSSRWGFPEHSPYSGSVEHVRVEMQRYIPAVPVYNAKTLLRKWRATELPGVAKERVVNYAEPVYYVPKYRVIEGKNVIDAHDTGKKNAPVAVVKWTPQDAPFALDLGTLEVGRPYAVRVIAATPIENIRRDTLRLVINAEINDAADGKTNFYRKRVSAIDEFYSVVEFFFWATQKRAYNIKLSLDASTKLPFLLVHDFDLHDQFAQIAARAAKKSASHYDATARAAAWQAKGIPAPDKVLPPDERAALDRKIWEQMPGLNVQGLEARDAGNLKEWEPYVTFRLPEGQTDDGLGVDFYDTEAAKARGLTRQTAYPAGTRRRNAIINQFNQAIALAKKYHETGDAQAGRDAAIYLASVAWKLPVDDSKQQLYLHDISPTFESEDTPFRRRSPAKFYNLRGQWPELSQSYDYLFPLLKDNAEIAGAVGQFLPWIKTPQNLQQFFDSTLLQYRMHQVLTYNARSDDRTPAWVAEIAGTQQDPQISKPWIDWLFRYVWTYPNPPLGVHELMANNIQRDGTHKIGSLYYAKSGNFTTEIIELLSTYKKFGGTLPYDVADARRFPKAAAMVKFPIESRVAGGYWFQIGDVGGPSEPRFGRWLDEGDKNLIRLGWRMTRDPRFAVIITRDLGRALESDEEWAAIQKAAAGRRDPVFENKSRVLSDWFGLLESGTQSDDFRFRRAAGLRVGEGFGHNHNDPLDLQIWAQGVPLAADAGQRPGYTRPGSAALHSHNLVVSPQSEGRPWIASFADVPGARYLLGKTSDNYVRQLALIDVDEGKPSAQPIPASPTAKLPTDVVAPNSYVVDVFRVRGGTVPAYAFHGPAADELVTNVQEKRAAKPNENKILNQFNTEDTKWVGTAPATLTATWRMRRDGAEYKGLALEAAEQRALGVNFDANAPRKFIRMHLPGYEGGKVYGARAVGEKVVHFTFENLYLEPANWPEQNGQAVFPVVYEPFAGEAYIESVKLLSPQKDLSDAGATVVLEVTLKNGRRDVIYCAPPIQQGTPRADTPVAGSSFNGEFGFISRDAQGVRQASLIGGTRLEAEGVLLSPERAAYEGEVKAVDYWSQTATLSTPLPAGSAGTVLEIGPPQRRTSYSVARSEGDKTIFDRGMDLSGSRIEGFDETGKARTTSPISRVGLPVSGDDGLALWRIAGGSKDYLVQLSGTPDAKTKFKLGEMLRVWEFGPGDKYRLPAWTSITRQAANTYSRAGNVAAPAKIGGREVK